ncbi:MAG: hypothetical protein AAGH79_10985 [Bacteroidota bacterium]
MDSYWIDTCVSSLLEEDHHENRRYWAQQILATPYPVEDLLGLFYMDAKAAQRLCWLMGDLCILQPGCLDPIVPLLFTMVHTPPFPEYRRTVAKVFIYHKIPHSLEGPATDFLSQLVADPKVPPQTKAYAMEALSPILRTFPALEEEVRVTIGLQWDLLSPSLKKAVRKLYPSWQEW